MFLRYFNGRTSIETLTACPLWRLAWLLRTPLLDNRFCLSASDDDRLPPNSGGMWMSSRRSIVGSRNGDIK